VRDLRVVFRMAIGEIEALQGVDFDIEPGSTVALVGESGSGKSVTAQAVEGILPTNARITSGQLIYKDPVSDTHTDIATLNPDSPELQAIRGGRISIIFQEPMVSLSPLHTVGDQVSEALFLHHDVNRAQGIEQTEAMLEMVGFPDPARALRTYPFELSGGLRQRAMIAMALVCLAPSGRENPLTTPIGEAKERAFSGAAVRPFILGFLHPGAFRRKNRARLRAPERLFWRLAFSL